MPLLFFPLPSSHDVHISVVKGRVLRVFDGSSSAGKGWAHPQLRIKMKEVALGLRG